MHTFTDSTGRVWSLIIDINTLRRVRQLAAVDLMEIISSEEALKKLSDPVSLCDVLFAVVKPQADALKITDEAFAAGLNGDVLDAAANALLPAIVDFFPSPTRAMASKLLAAGRAHQQKAAELMAAKVDAAVLAMSGASAPSLPASSALTSDPSPSAS